jgi:uncharacterized protein
MTDRSSSGSAPEDHHHIATTLAPAWHTLLMILLVLGPAIESQVVSWRKPGVALEPPPAVAFYLGGTVVLCIFLAFTWWGLRLRGHRLQAVINGKWSNWKDVVSDIGLGVLFWGFWYIVLTALKIGLLAAGISNSHSSGMIFPHGALQVGLVVFNAALSGFVEEIVFRGYLMAQFTAWTQNAAFGVVMQGILFGAAHGFYLGARQVLLISASGMLVGILVLWRKSLAPAMVFHTWADIFGAVIVRGLPFQ